MNRHQVPITQDTIWHRQGAPCLQQLIRLLYLLLTFLDCPHGCGGMSVQTHLVGDL